MAEIPVSPASDIAELHFKSGLPGFPGSERFALVRWGATDGPYSVLVDLDNPDIRFLVVPPVLFFPEYEIELDDATVAKIGLQNAEDALILLIVSLGDRPEDATANLLGPIVINLRNLEGVQAVLANSEYSTKVSLLQAA